MTKNLTTRQRGISSKVLGVFSILLPFGIFIISGSSWQIVTRQFAGTLFLLTILCYIAILLIAIFGLIKGIKGLKLPQKKSAIIGIILCSIGFVLTVILGLWNMIIIFTSA